MCIRDRFYFESQLRNISRDVVRESSSFDPESRREGEEFSLREISREKLDSGRHFSAALDKGDHMAAQGKRYPSSVQSPTLGKSRALLPEKSPISTLSPGGKERRFRCARFSVKSRIGEGISWPRSTRAIIGPPTVRDIPPRSWCRIRN